MRDAVKEHYHNKALNYGVSKLREAATVSLLQSFSNKRILDIGCATGYLSKHLRTRDNFVVGFDISNPAIQKAKQVLNQAYTVDIERDRLPHLKKFDVIIFSEVIEHLFAPEETIHKICTHYLNPRGFLLISTPNILYWGYRVSFLRGKFEYTQEGPFDKGHIHFFSYASVDKLLANLRFRIVERQNLTGGLMGKMLEKSFPNLFAYHLIFLAQKTS